MPYRELLPPDLDGLDSSELMAKYRELGYTRDTLAGDHSADAETRKLKIDIARERLRQELRHRGIHL